MRRFRLHRFIDESGVSGLGIVARGVEFPTGKVALEFVPIAAEGGSVAIWDSLNAMIRIHGHNGATVVEWIDEEDL